MKIRDIERLLSANGIGRSKMDMVTRRLRETGELPKMARGANAPEATADHAVKVLIATAGSSKAVAADRRLGVLVRLSHNEESLPNRLKRLLNGGSEIDALVECRIGRNVREATLLFDGGVVEKFEVDHPPEYSKRLRVEGVIPGELMRLLSKHLKSPNPISESNGAEEEDSD